jgi:hypothetical protein
MAYNASLSADQKIAPINTLVFGHSEGTSIVNEAVRGLHRYERHHIELYNFGTATGTVPRGLASYRSIENILDPVPMVVSRIAGGGGVATSRGFISGVREGRDYQQVFVAFNAQGTHSNHSLPYYFVVPEARAALNFVPLTPQIQDQYRRAPWFEPKKK